MAANESIEIGGTTIAPGERVNVNLPVADLYTSTSLHMPVQVICGNKSGPVLFVSAAIHGDAPLSRIPLFVRGGAVIPMLPDAPATTMELRPEIIELHVFVPGSDGTTESLLYEDDGWSLDHRAGAYLLTEMVVRRDGRELAVSASVSGEGYPDHRRRELVVVFHGAAEDAAVNGQPRGLENGRLILENDGQGFEVTVRLP